jgi:Fe2+ or Zn2+ uptake regulation protein
MPVAAAERRKRTGGRQECKRDVMQVVREAGRALTRKEVVKALRLAGKDHGPGTVAKALADLTSAGELVNLKDKRGYRLPGRGKDGTPSLFD